MKQQPTDRSYVNIGFQYSCVRLQIVEPLYGMLSKLTECEMVWVSFGPSQGLAITAYAGLS